MAFLVKGLAGVFLGLVGMLGILHQVQAELRVTMSETSPVQAARGSNLTLTCHINQKLAFLLSNNVFWHKESHIESETLSISRQQTLLVNSSLATHYNVNIDSKGNWTNVTLQIRNVEDSDDGRYVCSIKKIQHETVIGSGDINVIVPNAATNVTLIVDGVTAAATTAANASSASSSTTKVTAGVHTVQCLSEGSNPEVVVRRGLNRRPVGPGGNISVSLMPEASRMAGAPRYRVQVEGPVQLTQSDNGKRLSCETVDAHRNTTATTLVIVAKPTVHCDDVKVSRNHTHVELVCMVTHADVTLLDYLWELPSPGIDNFTQRAVPNTKNVSESRTKASLSLDVARWGKPRTLFRLTVVTEVGDVSEEAFIILVSDEESGEKENESDHDGDDSDNDGDDHDHDHDHDNDKSSARGLTMMAWNPILLLLLLKM